MKNCAICLQLGIVIYNLASSVLGYEICDYLAGNYCDDGKYCCGYDNNLCCDYLGTAAITGIVIGGIIFIAVVVTLCVVCVCGVGKRGSSGNIINPHPGAQMQVISTGYVQPGGSGVVYPPGQAPAFGPPGGSGAVYPPGQAPNYGPPPTGAYPPPPPAYGSEKAQQSGV